LATEQIATPIREALRACRRHLRAAALFSACLNLLYIAPTLYMLQVYDRAVPTHSGRTLAFLTLILLVALGTLALLDQLRGRLLVRAGILFDHLLAPVILQAAMGGGAGAESRQALREFDLLRSAVTGPAILAMFDAPWAPVYVLVCFIVHPAIGLLALVGMIILPIIVWRSEAAAGPRLARAQEEAGRTYVAQDQMLAAAPALSALGMRPALIARQLRLRRKMMALQTEASFALSSFASLSRFVRLSLQSLGLGLGALLAMDNLISGGAIFAASFLISRALAPIEQLIGTWKTLAQARAGYRNLDQLLRNVAPEHPRTNLPAPRGELSVEGLTLRRAGRETPILDGISFRLGAGDVVGIVGPSGAGKSTLLNVISGAIAPTAGIVRFDGADREDWDPDRLGSMLGLMPQQPSLLAGTVKENIARFSTEVEENQAVVDEQVILAATKAGAHDLILQLEGGYDYLLSNGGTNLSSGQAQRVALARSLFGEPAVLMLDEPNAHLDSNGDAGLLATIKQLKDKGVTVLIVSHRLSILPVVDKLMVIRAGKLEMFGPRDEVLAKIMPGGIRPVASQQVA
jgi:ATP-binding cassette, subfamily C, bacterial exporter for protease/lipase